MKTEITQYGFTMGPLEVVRCCSDEKKGWAVVQLKTAREDIQVYVTKTGKVRIHSGNGKEWKP